MLSMQRVPWFAKPHSLGLPDLIWSVWDVALHLAARYAMHVVHKCTRVNRHAASLLQAQNELLLSCLDIDKVALLLKRCIRFELYHILMFEIYIEFRRSNQC